MLFTTGYASENGVLSGATGLSSSDVIHKPIATGVGDARALHWTGRFGLLEPCNKLLVIDDQADLCEFISEAARPWASGARGHRAGCVPAQAGEISADGRSPGPAVPGADGIELLRYLGERGGKAHVPVASGMDQRVLATAQQIGRAQKVLNVMLGALQKTDHAGGSGGDAAAVPAHRRADHPAALTAALDRQGKSWCTTSQRRRASRRVAGW